VGHCSHLSIEEREDVMLLARQHTGVREIARTIGRDKSTVSGELTRNSSARAPRPTTGRRPPSASTSARIWRRATRRSTAPSGREGSTARCRAAAR
jgi:IS30 family transposase